MQVRPFVLPLAVFTALAASSALHADAGGLHRKPAQLRISVTLVDSCEIELPGTPDSGATAQVECSEFMPHQQGVLRRVDGERTVMTGSPDGVSGAEALPAHAPHPAMTTETSREAGDVTVATVTF